jgi:hypothetical protein
MALRDEKTGKFIPQETKSIKEIAANIKNENDANKTQQQLLIAGNKINELKLKSEDLGTQKLDYTLQAIMDRLSNPKTTESGMKTALANLDNLVAESNALEASRAQAADLAADKSTQGLQQLTDSIKNQNAIINSQLDMNKLGDQISKLNTGVGRLYDNEEARMQIEESFAEGQSALLRAIEEGDNQAAEIAMKQLAAVGDSAGQEEARREAAAALDAQQSSLNRIGDNLQGLGGKFDSFADGVKGTGGFLAGLTGLALAIFSPETLGKFINDAITGITNVINGIVKLFQGDVEGAFAIFGDNLGTVAAIFAGIALQFGGAIIAKVGALFKGIQTVMTGLKIFQAFMMTTAFPAIGAFFSGMITSISAALVPMLPIIAIGAGIALLLGGLYLGFQKLRESLGPGAGILDTLKVAGLYLVDFLSMLVNGITFIPRKLIGLLGPTAAKFLFGDDFDTSAIEKMAEGLDTNRGARAAEELRTKNELKAEEERLNPPSVAPEGLSTTDLTTADLIMGTSKENDAMVQEMGFGTPAAAPIVSNVKQGDTSTNTTIVQSSRRERRGYYLSSAVAV